MIYKYICLYICTYIFTHTQTHIHTHTLSEAQMLLTLAPNKHEILVFSNRRAYSNASWLDIKYFFMSRGNYRQYLNFKCH